MIGSEGDLNIVERIFTTFSTTRALQRSALKKQLL